MTQNSCLSVCFPHSFTETSLSSHLLADSFMQYSIKCLSDEGCFYIPFFLKSVHSLCEKPIPTVCPFEADRARLPPRERICPSVSLWRMWKIFCGELFIFHLSNHPAGALFPNFTVVCCFEFTWFGTKPNRGHIWCRQCHTVNRALPWKKNKLLFIQQPRTNSVPWAGPNGAVQRDCRNRWTASKLWRARICSNPTPTRSYRKLLLLRCRLGCGRVDCRCLSQVQTPNH